MSAGRFKLGQIVRYYPGRRALAESKQTCVVIEMLPKKDRVFEYRIRGIDDQHERVAKETELQSPFRQLF